MNNISIAAIQLDIIWENRDANLQKIQYWIEKYSSKADIIVFPEMFLTGFSMNVFSNSIENDSKTLKQLSKWANQYKIAIAGSLMIKDNERYFNRFFFFEPNGQQIMYDKRHLFRMANEHKTYASGNKSIIINYLNWSIKPSICYDLRFPVWLRNKNNYDVLLVVANWPKTRIDAWKKLLMARAIENQCYVIGVNRCGTDGNGVKYNGATMFVDFKGNVMNEANDNSEMGILATLSYSALSDFRKEFPAYLDADEFDIKIND